MLVKCEDCGKTYDDAARWTICPHPPLEADIRRYSDAEKKKHERDWLKHPPETFEDRKQAVEEFKGTSMHALAMSILGVGRNGEDLRDPERIGQVNSEGIMLMAVGKLHKDVMEMRRKIAKTLYEDEDGNTKVKRKEIDSILLRVETCLSMVVNS